MTTQEVQQVIDKMIGQIFGYQNPFTLEQFMTKFTFDLRLPQQVYDSQDGTPTWAQSVNPTKFITMQNAWKRQEQDEWLMPKRELSNLQEVLSAWNDVNYTATERQIESQNVSQSDNIYNSQNVFRSMDIHNSKNVIYSDTVLHSEFVGASQRSQSSSYCLRLEDSSTCANSFNISWSNKITNSFFLHDCNDVHDSMFCSHMSGKRFCIANMQFEEPEYMQIREEVIKWILAP